MAEEQISTYCLTANFSACSSESANQIVARFNAKRHLFVLSKIYYPFYSIVHYCVFVPNFLPLRVLIVCLCFYVLIIQVAVAYQANRAIEEKKINLPNKYSIKSDTIKIDDSRLPEKA